MERLWCEFKEVFNDKLGCLTNYTHKIIRKEATEPVACKMRGVPLALRESLQSELNKLKGEGTIVETEATEWLARVVLASKPSGKVRLYVDLRGLNSNVVTDKYPLPYIAEMLALVEGTVVFSTLYLSCLPPYKT